MPHDKGSLPITIAVTGHRDLLPEYIPSIEERVRSVFRDFETRYPQTPLTLLTSLAEGADRLVARIALEFGVTLICPLPMQRDLYEADFETPESRKEFRELLDKAEQWFEMPLLAGSTTDQISRHGFLRDKQYAYAGAYLARHSQVIIALWDGSPIELVGGTTYIVGFKLKGIPPPYIQKQGRFDPEEIGPVYHILSPRITHPLPEGIPASLTVLYPRQYGNPAAAKKMYDRILDNTSRFNIDELELKKLLDETKKRSEGYLVSDMEFAVRDKQSKSLLSNFSLSDSLAIFFQKKTYRISVILFFLALAGTIIFELYAYLMIDSPVLLILFFLVLAVAYGLFLYSTRKRFHEKFLDYRTLAEGLRIQFYWKLLGINYSVANYYLGDQHGELDWIRHALRSWTIPFSEEAAREVPVESSHQSAVIRNWVDSQFEYFGRTSYREKTKERRISRFATFALIAGFGLIGFDMIYQFLIGHSALPLVLYISSVMPIIAGLLFGYSEKRALRDHVKQYERMGELFSVAKYRIDILAKESDFPEIRNLLFDLGKEALKENGMWAITHHKRPIEFPITQ